MSLQPGPLSITLGALLMDVSIWKFHHITAAFACHFIKRRWSSHLVWTRGCPIDTLFMVFEEDYRFFPIGKDPDNADSYQARKGRLLQTRGDKGSGKLSLPPAGQSQGKADHSLPPASKGSTKAYSRFHEAKARGSSDLQCDNHGCSENVADLVRMATFASRQRMGDLIWVGYVPEKKRPSRLSNGSHLIMLSKFGLTRLGEAIREGSFARGHVDLSLKALFTKQDIAQQFNACY